LIPGPNSTEIAIHCGCHRAGLTGLIVAGLAFIFPAASITCILAYIYVHFGQVPQIEPFFYGIKPAVIIIILNVIYTLDKKALKNVLLGFIGIIVIVLSILGLSEVLAILCGGIIGIILISTRDKLLGNTFNLFLPPSMTTNLKISLLTLFTTSTAVISSASLLKLFLIFLKIGAILFGSGYVLVAYLDGELVKSLGWITAQELIDAIAIGQFTPGPVLSTATFIGYQIKGIWGAVVATFGIFLPSFLFVVQSILVQ
jgi:chromate transporter